MHRLLLYLFFAVTILLLSSLLLPSPTKVSAFTLKKPNALSVLTSRIRASQGRSQGRSSEQGAHMQTETHVQAQARSLSHMAVDVSPLGHLHGRGFRGNMNIHSNSN